MSREWGESGEAIPQALYQRALANAIRGRRGQALLAELATVLDAMPVRELADGALVDVANREECNGWLWSRFGAQRDGTEPAPKPEPQFGLRCAIGELAHARGIDDEHLFQVDPDGDDMGLTAEFGASIGIRWTLASEIARVNDSCPSATPAERWQIVRDWVAGHLVMVAA